MSQGGEAPSRHLQGSILGAVRLRDPVGRALNRNGGFLLVELYGWWYGSAFGLAAITWWLSARWTSPARRACARSGALAFGFTTLPVIGPDGGFLLPAGLYFLARSAWLGAALGAASAIIPVWGGLFVAFVAIPAARAKGADSAWRLRMLALALGVGIPCTALGLILSEHLGSPIAAYASWLLLLPATWLALYGAWTRSPWGLFSLNRINSWFFVYAALQFIYYLLIVIAWVELRLARRDAGSESPSL